MSEKKNSKKTLALDIGELEDITDEDGGQYQEPTSPPLLPAEESFWKRTLLFSVVVAVVMATIAYFVVTKWYPAESSEPATHVEIEEVEVVE